MLLRAFLLSLVSGLVACGSSPPGKIMADTPILPYQAPDVDEITGIDSEEETEEVEDEVPEAAPAPAPAPPTTAPAAAPAKAPAKPAAGTAPAPKK